jgi:hypothetical protein
LALQAPGRLWVTGESADSLTAAQAAYRAAGDEKKLTTAKLAASEVSGAAVTFLLSP